MIAGTEQSVQTEQTRCEREPREQESRKQESRKQESREQEAAAQIRRLHGLAMLASSAAGVPQQVRVCAPGEAAWSDRTAIHLDLSLPDVQLREAAVAQALLVAAGSLSRAKMRGLIGRPAATRRYFFLELQRALGLFGGALPLGIERGLAAFVAPQVQSAADSPTAAVNDVSTSDWHPLPLHLGRIRPSRLAWSRRGLGRRASQAEDGDAPRLEIERHDGDDEEVERDSSRWLQWFSTPLGGGEISSLFLKLMGFGRSPAPDEGEGEGGGATALADDATAASGSVEQAEGAAAATARPRSTSPEPPARFLYPEWKDSAGRYLPRHVHVYEMSPWVEPGGPRDPVRISRRAVRAQIARVGVALRRHRAQPDGDALDLDRVIRFGIERRHGAPPDRLHEACRRTHRDLSLLVMLDASGSTADELPSGDTIFSQQRELAREVVRACGKLGDRVALSAFHSWGRHNVRCMGIKGFSQPVGRAMDARLDALEPAGLTRLGAAIRHGTHLLAEDEGHSHRVMLLLSDGFAYDDEYREGHAEADTQRALAEAADAGIACVCLNVGSQQDDETLQRLYGGAAYLRCADARRAVPALGRLMLNAIAAARQARGPGVRKLAAASANRRRARSVA